MCGLFGWNFKKKAKIPVAKREAMATILAIANSYRGDKSWGMFFATKKGSFIRKEVGDIAESHDLGQYGRLSLVMAHTRQPTMGVVNRKNAHPFTVGKIVLAHNGTISNVTQLDKKYSRSVQVDSQHFAYHLNDGIDFADIEGYGAIEWINTTSPRRVYISRLRNGSLSARGIKNGKGEEVGVVWSSEGKHLDNAIAAARMDSYPYESLEEGKIFYAEDGVLYTSDDKKLIVSEPSYKQYAYQGGYGSYVYHGNSEVDGYWITEEKHVWRWIDGRQTTFSDYEEEEERRLYGIGD